MASTIMLSSDIRGRLRAALDALSDEDIEKLGFNRDMVADVVNELGHERSLRAAYATELSQVKAQLVRAQNEETEAADRLRVARAATDGIPWDRGQRESEAAKALDSARATVAELEGTKTAIEAALR